MSTNLSRDLSLQATATDNASRERTEAADTSELEAIELASTLPISRGSGSGGKRDSLHIFDKLCIRLTTFWNRQISIVVSHDDCRDHFGM
jgi:hypothetical protein